jgi:hypothetical protein
MKKLILSLLLIVLTAVSAHAIPELQLYIEGATYDSTSETWVTESDAFKIWVLGDVSAKGRIDSVFLSLAFPTGSSFTYSLTPTTATGITDPSTPSALTMGPSGGDGTVPLLGDGSALPSHGIFGPGTSWLSVGLGDFTLTDSPIGDFSVTYPSTFPDTGQINAYEFQLLTGEVEWIHFDAYDHYYNNQGAAKYIKAPFSHDGEGQPPGGGGPPQEQVPEPATILLLGGGLLGMAFYGRNRIRK